jgi:hypothetical protein
MFTEEDAAVLQGPDHRTHRPEGSYVVSPLTCGTRGCKLNCVQQELSVWEASMHGRDVNHRAARERQIRSLKPVCYWSAACFDRTAPDDPERCLLHHPARSAPHQMPRVTGVAAMSLKLA